ncbi:hypothetical protein QYE76_029770 [Lolium multiflorum]|uniref:F-box domain-containing protein n=1 Tax=Lolium multiflorum TaxID=4521 RepID=A0AAD8QP77_LOLMU|nr:hypothetical protein QYE76_029770 [Lolium multiflorum]
MGALCSSLGLTTRRSYDLLPPELLDLVIAGLSDPADRARARAVCRSWHSAVRRRGAQPWRLPSTMSMCAIDRPPSLPCGGADIFGSTDDWLAVRVGKERGKFFLYNPFLVNSVPLPELEAVIGHDKPAIYKFLMRSGADDLIAITANNRRYAFMVIRPGKGVWLPPPRTRPYVDIIDFAFLHGKLYAITNAEDLITFDLALDGDERPMVTMGSYLIKNSPDHYNAHHYEEAYQVAAAPDDISFHNCSSQAWSHPGSNALHITSRSLVESGGKLLMVRHYQQFRKKMDVEHLGAPYVTRGVEVFEADPNAGAWKPVTGGLGGGRALFISMHFSKSVAAPCGEVEEDLIYFMGTEILVRKYSRNWTKLSPGSYFCTKPEDRRDNEWGHEAARGQGGAAQALAARPYPLPRVAPALTFRLLKVSVAKPPDREPRYGKPSRDAAAANPISGIQEIASGTLPERGFISRRTLHRHGRLRSDE